MTAPRCAASPAALAFHQRANTRPAANVVGTGGRPGAVSEKLLRVASSPFVAAAADDGSSADSRRSRDRDRAARFDPLQTLDDPRLPLNHRGTILWQGCRFQIFPPDIGFLFQLIGQYQQVPVNQSVAVGWNARHSPQEFCFLAKLLNTDHMLNVSSVSAPALDGRLVGSKHG